MRASYGTGRRMERARAYALNGRSERLRNALETGRLQRALAGVPVVQKTVRQFRDRLADNARLTEYVYPEKARLAAAIASWAEKRAATAAASADDTDGEDRSDDDGGGGEDSGHRTPENVGVTWDSSSSVRSTEPENDSDGNSTNGGSGDGDGRNSDSYRPLESAAVDVTSLSGYPEVADEEADGGEDESSFANTGLASDSSYRRRDSHYYDDGDDFCKDDNDHCALDHSAADVTITRTTRLTRPEAYGLAYTLEKFVNRVRVFEAIDGAATDSDDDGCADDSSSTTAHSDLISKTEYCTAPRSNKSLVLRTLEHTARELKSHGTFDALRRLNDAETQRTREENELLKEYSDSVATLRAMLSDNDDKQGRLAMEKYPVQKKKYILQEQFEAITRQIEIEDEYFQARADQWVSENKELLKVKERKLRNEIKAIDDRIDKEDECTKEAKRIFTEYTKTIMRHVETWEDMYDTDMGVIDREIMNLENEEIHEDELYEELFAQADLLKTEIDEREERKRKREEKKPAVYYL